SRDDFREDKELLVMLEKLEYLGKRSLPTLRAEIRREHCRESLLAELVEQVFDSSKYLSGSYRYVPRCIARQNRDPEYYPDFSTLESIAKFLVYKDLGLVGIITGESSGYSVNNLCADVWRDYPAGESTVSDKELAATLYFHSTARSDAVELCGFLGFNVDPDNTLLLAAISLNQLADGYHVLAYGRYVNYDF
ncbi:hypothetical protein SCD92_19720, partial [Gilvimarinus sp. SDUM040013]